MSSDKENPPHGVIQTDEESQEYGSQHGQDTTGHETGSSAGETGAESSRRRGDEATGEGTGSRAGEYS